MLQRLRSHVTYANVMATLAVFFILGGGTAFAAFVVSSNSQVGPGTISGHHPPTGKHANIIGGSINAQDVAVANRNGTATTPSLRTLGTGALQAAAGNDPRLSNARPPNGTAGGDLDGTYPNPQIKPEIALGSAGLNDIAGFSLCTATPDQWLDLSPNVNNPVSFTRDPLGLVHLHGVATKCGTPGSGDTIFTLPSGSRPSKLEHFGTVAADAFGAAVVDPNGHVTVAAGNVDHGGGGWISLDGLTFRCGPAGQNGCP
jgi:hypothetical protein